MLDVSRGAGVTFSADLHWNQWFKANGTKVGAFATHFRTYFSGDWDAHWGYRVLTHGHISGHRIIACPGTRTRATLRRSPTHVVQGPRG